MKTTTTDLLLGYEENLDMVVKNAKFQEDYMEMVTVRDIEFHSLCEHHLIPFFGKVIEFNSCFNNAVLC